MQDCRPLFAYSDFLNIIRQPLEIQHVMLGSICSFTTKQGGCCGAIQEN